MEQIIPNIHLQPPVLSGSVRDCQSCQSNNKIQSYFILHQTKTRDRTLGDRSQDVLQGLPEDVVNSVADDAANAGVPHRNLSLVSGQETRCQEDVVVQAGGVSY